MILTVLALTVSFAVYLVALRPRLRLVYPDFYAKVEAVETTWFGSLFARVKRFWDVVTAVCLMVGPEIPDMLEQLAGYDLTAIGVPGDAAKIVLKLLGLVLIFARAFKVVAAAKRA
jgi:hypothetical protein